MSPPAPKVPTDYADYGALRNALGVLEKTYGEVLSVEELGRSDTGRGIPAIRIGPRSSTPLPALLVTGNIHPAEVLGSVVALAFAESVARAPGRDAVVYVVPRVCVDSTDRYLTSAELPRGNSGTPEAHEIGDRHAADIDGDGRILDLRVPSPQGQWRIGRNDPLLMVPRSPFDSEGPFYDLWPESRKGPAPVRPPVDLNRNFDWDWKPGPWSGPGPFSQPESRALRDFVLHHPEIVLAVDLHTYAGHAILPTRGMNPDLAHCLSSLVRDAFDFPTVTCDDGKAESPQASGSFVGWMHGARGITALGLELYGPHYFSGVLPRNEVWTLDTVLLEPLMEQHLAWIRRHAPESVIEWRSAPAAEPGLNGAELGGIDRRFIIDNPPRGSRLLADQVEQFNRFATALVNLLPRPEMRIEVAKDPASESALVKIEIRESSGGPGWAALTGNPAELRLELEAETTGERSTVPLGPVQGQFPKPGANWFNSMGTVLRLPPVPPVSCTVRAGGSGPWNVSLVSERTGRVATERISLKDAQGVGPGLSR